MERNEISLHEIKIYHALEKQGTAWSTSKKLASLSGIAERTARAHLLKFVKLNIVDVAEVFPAHRYRLAEKADKRNTAYMVRIKRASEVFGETM